MTSIEALEYLMKNAITIFPRDEDSLDNCFKCYKEIKKDLEVLDMLKHHIKQSKTIVIYDEEVIPNQLVNYIEKLRSGGTREIDMLSMEIKETDNNYYMIKEWLENDNR